MAIKNAIYLNFLPLATGPPQKRTNKQEIEMLPITGKVCSHCVDHQPQHKGAVHAQFELNTTLDSVFQEVLKLQQNVYKPRSRCEKSH